MRSLALVAGLLWTGGAQAETVVVRGGEHADFTRLVLPVPDGTGWSFVPAPGGFDLILPEDTVFDLGRAFDRIPRDRIQALHPLGGGRLSLSVLCDCHAEAVPFRSLGLVIDVIDGPAPPGGLTPGRIGAAASAGLPLVIAPPPTPPVLGLLASGIPDEAPITPLAEQADAEAQRIAQAEAEILEGLAAAATQGLLDIAPARSIPVAPALAHAADGQLRPDEESPAAVPSRPSSGLIASNEFPAEPRPGITFRTGASSDSRERVPLGATGTTCLPKEAFDLAAWGGSGPFDLEITSRLAQISDERDRLDAQAVEALARTYLAFGFGREALVTLSLDSRSSRERDMLQLLARLLDEEAVPSGAFEDQAGCLGPVALWRALGRQSLRGTDEHERAAMMVALRALPLAVRGHVALRLARLLLDDGDALEAAAAASLADGTGSEDPLTRAGIMREMEGRGPALAELESVAESHARMSPDAMVEFIDLLIADGRPVPADTLDLVRALRFEHGGADARALLLAEARALVAASRYEEALVLLEQERTSHPGDDVEAALTATILALSEGADDASFLEIALSGMLPELPQRSRDHLARRLAELGFPDEARALRAVAAPPSAPPETNQSDMETRSAPDPQHSRAVPPRQPEPDSTPQPSGGWMQPPPMAESLAALPAAEPLLAAPTRDPAPLPLLAAAPGPADPMSAGGISDPAEALATLAARRALLEGAGEARERAAALLRQAPAD